MDTRLLYAINGLAGRYDLVDDMVEMISHYGPLLMVAILVGLWFWPAARDQRDRFQSAVIIATFSATLALGVNQVIIRTWDRPRPFAAHAVTLLLAPSKDPSFPSDHAAFAFAVAVAVLLMARRVGWLLLAMAALIGLARVYAGEHYPGDVVAGAAVGSLVATLCAAQYSLVAPVLDPMLQFARRIHLA